MKRKIFILALLIFIVSMGCASAAEDNATDALTLDVTSEVLASDYGGNFGELFNLIDNAEEGDTIILNKDYNGSGSFTIDKGLTIDGRGHTIDANFESYIFYVDAESDVYLYDIKFTRGYDDITGGAIYAKSPLYISNCEFTYNIATDDDYTCYGGAIYSASKLVILNSIFEGNRADRGGAIGSSGDLYINNTVFRDNYAFMSGGAIFADGENAVINASGFENNTAQDYGGSIFAKKTLILTNSILISNDDAVEIIDYYNYDDDTSPDIYLYLYNNLMYTPNAYSIWYESMNPIISPVYLTYTHDECEKGDTIEIAQIYDDTGNIIRYDQEFTVEIYDGNKLIDEAYLEYDEEMGGYFYECDLDNGTYTLTGTLSDEFVDDLTVIDGELVVGSSKTTPTVTTSCDVNENSVTLTAELKPSAATGTVTFNVAGKSYTANVKNGKATKTLSNLAEGSYTVKTTYSGDENYNSANAKQISFTVGGSPGEKTTPTVTTSYEQNKNSVTLTAELDPSDASGTVTFNVNNKNYNAEVTNGKATRTLNKLADGSYTVKTSYSGDENYNSANAKEISFTIGTPSEKTTPTVTTAYTKDSSTVVTLTTTISPSDATGTVTYIINGEEYNPVAVTNGKATKRLSGLEEGSYTVKTTYSGDNNYNSANANQVSFVIASTGVNIDAPELVKYYGGSERFTVTLTENGQPLVGKTVKITINGQTYERTTDSSGKAGMNVNLNSKEYQVTVEAEGQRVSSKVTVKPTVSGNDITKIFKNGTQYYATFVDSQGNLLRNTDVNFNINGVFYTRKTDGNGVARMNINLNPKTYVITAKNPSTGEQYTNTITVLTNIIEHNDLTKYYKNDSQYRIRILADDGSIAKAGVKVTFNINGVFYDRYSDDNGYVQMRINLNPGDYIITADYNGLKASNNIKVLNILFGNNVNMEYKDGSKYTVKLLDGHGNPYSGQTVDLNINGVFYKRVTGSDGVASLNINLEGGSYVITASYNGLSCSNTVNVVVPMSDYEVGNYHFSVPKSCNVKGRLSDDRTSYTYTIDYTNGQHAGVSFQYATSSPLSYSINAVKSEYGAQEIAPYNGWVVLDFYNAVRQGYLDDRYYAFSDDGTYYYHIHSNDLGLCQQIISSFH